MTRPLTHELSPEEAARLDAETASRRISFLYESTASIFSSPVDTRTRLERLAEASVPELADWCLVELLEGDMLHLVAVSHWNPAATPLREGLPEWTPRSENPLVDWSLNQRRPVGPLGAGDLWDPHIPRTLNNLDARSFIVVPLALGDRVFGAVTFAYVESMRTYGVAERELATDLCLRAAQALESARLYESEREAVRARDAFLAVASHDLRNPLNAIVLQAASLKKILHTGTSPEKALPRLDRIIHSTGRMVNLLDELLDVSRIQAGRLELDPVDTDVAEIARAIIGRFEEDPETRSPIELSSPPAVQGVWDPLRLDQILTNLISNAVKYGADQPIDIEIAVEDGWTRIDVKDRGIGIAKEHQARIFERFERAAADTSIRGTGVGLWIVKQLAVAHGGTVSVESVPGQGSSFTVRLPGGRVLTRH